MSYKGFFASDNYAGVHPQVLDAISTVNPGYQIAYGDDSTTSSFDELVIELFGDQALGFPVFNGTGANVIALQALTPRWGAVICAETAHVNLDEGGAPEKMAGLKLWNIPIPNGDGKLTPELIAKEVRDVGFVHRAQQSVVTIANTTEYGTVYTPKEIREIADFCHANSLALHLDGARISNAVAALGVSLRELTTDAGVDILSFGGTKIGGLAAEAVVVLDKSSKLGAEAANALPYLRKTSMQLASKMRFISAQLIALYGKEKLGFELATHANSKAQELNTGLAEISKEFPNLVQLPVGCQANAVFPILETGVREALAPAWYFYDWDKAISQVRLMCSWDTSSEQVAQFLLDLREACNKRVS